MTSNQIEYAKHIESARHNVEMESQGRDTISENKRHNRRTEDIGYGNIDVGWGNVGASYAHAAAAQSSADAAMANVFEVTRHNQEQEALTQQYYDEINRHNTINETIDQAKLSAYQLLKYGALKSGKYFGHLLADENAAQGFVKDRQSKQQGGISWHGTKK